MRVSTTTPTTTSAPQPGAAAPAVDGFGALLAALLPQPAAQPDAQPDAQPCPVAPATGVVAVPEPAADLDSAGSSPDQQEPGTPGLPAVAGPTGDPTEPNGPDPDDHSDLSAESDADVVTAPPSTAPITMPVAVAAVPAELRPEGPPATPPDGDEVRATPDATAAPTTVRSPASPPLPDRPTATAGPRPETGVQALHRAEPAAAEQPTASTAGTQTNTAASAPAPTVAPTAAPTPSSGTQASSVAQQVFDRIERLASSGDGTHRVTLRLDPGTLGEVRVMLTVRDGRVRVRLAAGDEARLALTQGVPDLQRLLQRHGAGEVRVDVTAFPGSTSQPSGQPADPQSGSQSGQPHDLSGTHTGREDSGSETGHQGAPARTRTATTARDGAQDRVQPPGSVEPRRSTPLGVDVRM